MRAGAVSEAGGGGEGRPGPLRVASAILAMPFAATVAIPTLIVGASGASLGWGAEGAALAVVLIAAAAMLAGGLALFVATARLFAAVGQGTLAPWDPPKRLVVRGPYRHLRHPMISGVALVLAAETLALGSPGIAIELAIFVGVNAVYLPLVEEPALVRRYGEEYELYMANVGRWLPRLRPWRPPASPR